jgi:hypothetical protein
MGTNVAQFRKLADRGANLDHMKYHLLDLYKNQIMYRFYREELTG